MELILLILWLPVMLLLAGIWSALSPFSMAYWLFTAGFAWTVSRLVGSRAAAWAALVGAAGTWAAIVVTERRLPQTYPQQLGDPNAEAGFPFVAFRYPVPPMGGDVPPLGQWLPFFADYAIWLAFGLALAPWLARLLPERRCRTALVAAGAVLIGVLGLGRTLLKFD